jgi:hypothetical protein
LPAPAKPEIILDPPRAVAECAMRWLFTAPARAVALACLLAAVVAWLWWGTTRGPDLSYLPARSAVGKWIVYPAPPSLTMIPGARMPAEFRRTFECATAPTGVPLRLLAFRDADVFINGKKIGLAGEGSWKTVRRATVGKALHRGTNTIAVKVRNWNGRPAVSL